MKFNQISILFGALALIMTSCADESLGPILTFDKATKGAYVRRLEESDKLINLFNVAASKYTYSVEFVDLEKGALVAEYVLDIIYVDNNPDNGNKSVGPKQFRSWSASDFETNAAGFKALSNITITAQEAIAAAGITEPELLPGDQFQFKGRIILQDGAVYTASNSSASVNGAGFRGHFDFTLPAGCPSSLKGSYAYTGTETWCGNPAVSGTVTIIEKGDGVYGFNDWSLGSYTACYGSFGSDWGQLAFKDVCAVVSFSGFTDAFGDTWTFTHSVAGPEWTISYTNTYGESGSAVINAGGKDWPFTVK